MKMNTPYQEKSKEELIQLLTEKDVQIDKHADELFKQSNQINILTELLRIYRYRQFGTKSEKSSDRQLGLFDEAELPKNIEAIQQAEREIHVPAHTRQKLVGRKPLPQDLPREQYIYDLPEAEKTCHCGEALTHIKDETCEQLEIIPAKVYVVEHIRKKYACKHCEETIKIAVMPPQPIPRSIAGPGLLAHVLVSKFEDHLPLYRQEKMLNRIGVDIPRATMSLWVIRAAELLKPLVERIKDYVIDYDVAYSDETTLQVLKEAKKKIHSKKYMWVFSGGPPNQFGFYFKYDASRSQDVLLDFFNEFEGYVHCDGYSAYDALAKLRDKIILSGCLYHARRKFVEITKITKSKESVAHQVVKMISWLAKIEEEIKILDPETKKQIREEKAKPILENLHAYLIEMSARTPPKGLLGQAIFYTLNQWNKLLVYLNDGRLENNNNRSERAIKPFAIGRKGWLFANSVAGAEAAAIIYSLIETCKHHQIEAYEWLRYVLQKLPLCQSKTEIDALLPFNIDRALLAK